MHPFLMAHTPQAIRYFHCTAAQGAILEDNLRATAEVAPAPHYCSQLLLRAQVVSYREYFERDTSRFCNFSHLICFGIPAVTADRLGVKKEMMLRIKRNVVSKLAQALTSGYVASVKRHTE